MVKYIIHRLVLLFSCLIFSFAFFSSTKDAKADEDEEEAWGNAYLACLIDEDGHSYKFQVIYSGEVTEKAACFLTKDQIKLVNGRLSLINLNSYPDAIVRVDTSSGKITGVDGYVEDMNDLHENLPGDSDISYNYLPLTFPVTSLKEASAADINRAYEVKDAIGEDFMDALLFINDGKAFDNTETLIQTAYFLCIAGNEGTKIVNQFGNTYTVSYNTAPVPGTNGYLYACDITSDSGNQQSFNYKVKKGYINCKRNELMENGKVNLVASGVDLGDMGNAVVNGLKNDTEYVTWEYFFLEAGILYANGISYANQADLYSVGDLESSMLDLTRNLLGGIKNMLQLYSMEDLIFNLGIRSSSAFAYGIYNHNWDFNINIFYLIFTAISLSVILTSCIVLVQKKQLSTINPSSRVSLMEGFRNILFCILFIGVARIVIMFFMMFNQKFVEIFAVLVDGKTLRDNNNVYSTLSAILLQFAFLIIEIYLNYIYIMRGLMVAALVMVASPCITAFTFGQRGQMITKAYIREFLSLIFIQAIHAFCYGFILMSSTGLRGIESIIICTSIIPLTSLFKNVFGVGADGLIRAASGATVAATAAGTAAVSGAAGVISTVTPAPVSTITNMASGAFTAASGAGLSLTDDPIATINGSGMIKQGFRDVSTGFNQGFNKSVQYFKNRGEGYSKMSKRRSSGSSDSVSPGAEYRGSSGGGHRGAGGNPFVTVRNGEGYSDRVNGNNHRSGSYRNGDFKRFQLSGNSNSSGDSLSSTMTRPSPTYRSSDVPFKSMDNNRADNIRTSMASGKPVTFSQLRSVDNLTASQFSKKYNVPYKDVRNMEKTNKPIPYDIVKRVMENNSNPADNV